VYVADYDLPNAYMKAPIEIGAQNDRLLKSSVDCCLVIASSLAAHIH
jgi:hypothetical protein